MGQGAMELSLNYARDRKAYGNSIAELLSIKWLLAEIYERVSEVQRVIIADHLLRGKG
ncbi:MAG: hypothetical protein KAH98_04970 [Dehalococcoidia bacterium]|nr:hypothetical protein [Dehalococcoidia bacterium]